MAGRDAAGRGKGCLQRTAHWQQWVFRWQHQIGGARHGMAGLGRAGPGKG